MQVLRPTGEGHPTFIPLHGWSPLCRTSPPTALHSASHRTVKLRGPMAWGTCEDRDNFTLHSDSQRGQLPLLGMRVGTPWKAWKARVTRMSHHSRKGQWA